jgi:hypothetical protein
MAYKVENIYYLVFNSRNLLIPDVKHLEGKKEAFRVAWGL